MISGVRDMVDEAYERGKSYYTTFRKVPPIASVQGNWVDLSMASGNPKPNYYIGAERMATRLNISTDPSSTSSAKGIYSGGNVSPDVKHLHKIGLTAVNAGFVPCTITLCDYLLCYPTIDMDNDSEQLLLNYAAGVETPTTSPDAHVLPRYTDGVGVKAFLVAFTPYIGGPTFSIKYTNTDNETKYSAGMVTNTSTYIATIVHAGLTAGVRGPFIDLAPGDIGIKNIQSITFNSACGGLGVLVLVKPLATLQIREITTWCEFDLLLNKAGLPRVYDGAYLGMLCMPNGSVAGQFITGDLTFIWG